jgi:hypothetical protein
LSNKKKEIAKSGRKSLSIRFSKETTEKQSALFLSQFFSSFSDVEEEHFLMKRSLHEKLIA